jgi:cytochrome c oxidase subunit 2
MDKYELKTIGLSGILLAVFFFAVLYNSFGRKINMPTCIPFDKTFQRSEVRKIDEHLYAVYIVARMWSYGQDDLVIPPGSTVDFYLTSLDVVHGFHINEKGVNMMAVPGSVNKITARFEEPGEYRFVCNEFCGIGHQNMMGKIIVKQD